MDTKFYNQTLSLTLGTHCSTCSDIHRCVILILINFLDRRPELCAGTDEAAVSRASLSAFSFFGTPTSPGTQTSPTNLPFFLDFLENVKDLVYNRNVELLLRTLDGLDCA